MFLVAGLGNPGAKYDGTRHNIGFLFLDYLAARLGVSFSSSKWQADAVKTVCCGTPLLLVKPTTYMNRSGFAVGQAAGYYRIDPERVIVVHDDLDLPLARVKIVTGRGAGGHNGIRSMIEHLGSRDFTRIRVGIGRGQHDMDEANYVLSRFSADDLRALQERFPDMEEGVRLIVEEGVTMAMNRINALS